MSALPRGTTAVLDSFALAAYLDREPTGKEVWRLISSADRNRTTLLMSLINWGEVYYTTVKARGIPAAEEAVAAIDQLPIVLASPTREDALVAARMKAKYPVSYADCFAAALAHRQGCPVVTGDPDFRLLEREVKVRWLEA